VRFAGDSIPRKFPANQGSRSQRASAGSINAFDPEKYRAFIIFLRFWPWLGVRSTVRRASRPAPACEGLVCRLYNRCAIVRCGFGDLAFDSMRGRRARGTNRLVRCPQRQSRGRLELFENTEQKQSLAEKVRSQTRVICATPFGKGAEPGCWEWFLCCVCRSPR
jgi:hypothetical protein